MKMKRVYTASRWDNGVVWNKMKREKNFPLFFHARWLVHFENEAEATSERAFHYWQENIDDVLSADCVLFYAQRDDVLGGALVEVGAALANDIPVFIVGENEAIRCWQYHPAVKYVGKDMEEAILIIKNYPDRR